jgi:hypothetical protein
MSRKAKIDREAWLLDDAHKSGNVEERTRFMNQISSRKNT